MVEEMLAARGIIVSRESVRQWALKCEPKLARDRWRRHRARAACLARRQRRSRSSSEIRPAQHNAASKPPMVQITGQNARIAALSIARLRTAITRGPQMLHGSAVWAH